MRAMAGVQRGCDYWLVLVGLVYCGQLVVNIDQNFHDHHDP